MSGIQENPMSECAQNVIVLTGISQEGWRDVAGYEGLYQVSNYGRVKSFRRRGNNKDRILNPFRTSKKGAYRCVTLSKDGNDIRASVHRLVATAFHENPENRAEVNHKDGNPSNNHVDNLEWVTRSQNMLHAFATGLKSNKGENNNNHALTEREANFMRYIRGLYPEIKTVDIADFYGLAPDHVRSIFRFEAWTGGNNERLCIL